MNLADIDPAIISALSALGGIVISQLFEVLRSSSESRVRQSEKIVERRIAAHEVVLKLADDLIVMHAVGFSSKPGELVKYPFILKSREEFLDWYMKKFTKYYSESSAWLSTNVLREINLFQDYLVNLHMYLDSHRKQDSAEIGTVIHQDFIDFSDNLRRRSIKFLTSGAIHLHLKDLGNWHKYPIKTTEERLRKTELFRQLITPKDQQKED